MAEMKFLDSIPIHIDNTLYQLLGRFQSIKDGIPELLKNAKDQYSREGVTEKHERQILVMANSISQSIAVLDFAGATRKDFEYWQKWSDPTAHRGGPGSDIEGGHGNGGKGFMVRGSVKDSFFESCRDGRRTKMGYRNDRRFYPAFYLENSKPVDNLVLSGKGSDTVEGHLARVLKSFEVNIKDLPEQARTVFAERDGTLKTWGLRLTICL